MLLTCIPYSQVVCDAGCSCLTRIVFKYSMLLPWGEGYIDTCGPKGYGFLDVLVRVSILAILVPTRVWFLHSSLELGMFRRRWDYMI